VFPTLMFGKKKLVITKHCCVEVGAFLCLGSPCTSVLGWETSYAGKRFLMFFLSFSRQIFIIT
jgi:hypothetical protein